MSISSLFWFRVIVRSRKFMERCSLCVILSFVLLWMLLMYVSVSCVFIFADLDLTITRNQNKLEIDIYGKPTTTDTTINFLSNHPIEHRMAAYRYYRDRMHALPLDESKKQKEWQTIQRIGKSNNVPTQLLQKLNKRI